MSTSPLDQRIVTAHHEAAHAVVPYRVNGHAGGNTAITQDEESLGRHFDWVSDGRDPGDVEGRILSCYAGGHAQRRLDAALGDGGCQPTMTSRPICCRSFIGRAEKRNCAPRA